MKNEYECQRVQERNSEKFNRGKSEPEKVREFCYCVKLKERKPQ